MRSTTVLIAVALFGFSVAVQAHPDHGGKGDHHHDHDDSKEVSETRKKKRIERVIRQAERRDRNREQRAKDRRRHLRNRLGRHLKGADLTPEIVDALKTHAERIALLRQIRYLAAQDNDYETVVAADKVFSEENSNHERWWRTVLRAKRLK